MWMTVFGNSAIYLIMNQGATDLANTVQQDVSLALFNFLEHFPFSSVLSFIAMAMVIVFFVTSADSGAMVVDTLASGGVANTPVWQRIFWASLMGIVAIALLLAGGLSALQTVTIASALPFSVILLISIYGLLKALRRDLTKRESLSMATIAPTAARNPIPWQKVTQYRVSAEAISCETFYGRRYPARHDAGSGGTEQAGDDKPH